MKLSLLWLLTFVATTSLFSTADAKPTTGKQDAGVEIQEQRLIKFPDDLDTLPLGTNETEKRDEAERILHEIAKINEAFGYVRKQPQPVRLPSILDSEQYLFPNPTYHPFHAQNLRFPVSGGDTLLLPSIRSVDYKRSSREEAPKGEGKKGAQKAGSISVASKAKDQPKTSKHQDRTKTDTKISNGGAVKEEVKTSVEKKPEDLQLQEIRTKKPPEKTNSEKQTQRISDSQDKAQFHQVHLRAPSVVGMPSPQVLGEWAPLPTHFAFPVRHHHPDQEEYLRKHAPLEYRIKGYNLVGDIENFYGHTQTKPKSKSKNRTKTKSRIRSSPKYQLFLLPRDLALSAETTSKEATSTNKDNTTDTASREAGSSSSREEKHRPFKIQTSASTTNNNGITNSSTTMQIIRKRIVPRPWGGGDKDSHMDTSAGTFQQQRPGGPLSLTMSSVKITPPPNTMPGNTHGGMEQHQGGQSPSMNNNNNNNNNFFGGNFYKNNTNAIKTAFQNIFKLPFRQQPKPQPAPAAVESPGVMLQAVPLQQPLNPFYGSGPAVLPQPFYVPSNQDGDDDYRWDDEDVSNNAAEEEDSTEPQEEKHIFGFAPNRYKEQMKLQKEALKQGGIIIQRLRVRKGGIAIAGPGGVATAGSGGTAIVGPGGYALTHPRSLTIAGPGAKVIAIPADVDLGEALERTNLSVMSFPREGKIVATGPTVYYAPGTGAAIEI